MIEPKVQDGPKIVLDHEELEIEKWARKLFLDLDFGLGQQAKICKVLQIGPKRVLGPEKCFLNWDLDWANRPKFVKSYK